MKNKLQRPISPLYSRPTGSTSLITASLHPRTKSPRFLRSLNKKAIPLIFVLIFNLWIWKIFNFNFFIGLIVVCTSVSLYFRFFKITLVLFILLLFIQYKTSSINSLTFLNDNEKMQQIVKMHAYPPSLYRLANWLENRPEALVFYKLEENLSEVVDPNMYFFANHPRERVGVVEYEKFAYILLPFFVLGIVKLKRDDLKYLFISISPLALICLIGGSSPIGPFSLFPFITVMTASGLKPIFEKRKYLVAFLIVFGLVFIQTLAYAKY